MNSSGSCNVHHMNGDTYICKKTFVTLGQSRTVLPGDTRGTGLCPLALPLGWEQRGLLAKKRYSHHFNIFIISVVFLIADDLWSDTLLPSGTEQECVGSSEAQGVPLPGAGAGDGAWRSARCLCPFATLTNAVSCQSPILTIFFNGNMNSLVKFSPGYFWFCPSKAVSPSEGKPSPHGGRLAFLTCSCGEAAWALLTNTRERGLNAVPDSAALVKLMTSRKQKGNCEWFPLFSHHSRFSGRLKQNILAAFFFPPSNGLSSSGKNMNMQR